MANNTVYINDLYKAAAKAVGDTGIFPETVVTQKILESGFRKLNQQRRMDWSAAR